MQGPVQRGRGGVSQEAVPAAGEWVGLFSVFEAAYFKACDMGFVVYGGNLAPLLFVSWPVPLSRDDAFATGCANTLETTPIPAVWGMKCFVTVVKVSSLIPVFSVAPFVGK